MESEDIVRLSLFANLLDDLFLHKSRKQNTVYIDRELMVALYSETVANARHTSSTAYRAGYHELYYCIDHVNYKIELNPKPINRAKAQSTDKKGNTNEQMDVKTNEGSRRISTGDASPNRESGSTTVSVHELRRGEWWDLARKSCSSLWAGIRRQIFIDAADSEAAADRHKR